MAKQHSYEDDPPAYEEAGQHPLDTKASSIAAPSTAWSLGEHVGASRSQHIAVVVSQLVPRLRERASRGLAKSTLMLIPSDQDAARKGTLVSYLEDDAIVPIQLEGSQNNIAFWSQEEAIQELQSQLLSILAGSKPIPKELPERPVLAPEPPRKSSWFGRKASKAPEPFVVHQTPWKATAKVEVQLEEASFRSETEYGLFETLRARVIMAWVNCR